VDDSFSALRRRDRDLDDVAAILVVPEEREPAETMPSSGAVRGDDANLGLFQDDDLPRVS
jgi:hypothetical protein